MHRNWSSGTTLEQDQRRTISSTMSSTMSSTLVNSLMIQSLNSSDADSVRSLLHDECDARKVLDCFSNTALHYASEKGDADIVRLLVNNGADLEATNIHGETAFISAVKHGHLEVCKILLEGGCIIGSGEIRNIHGLTPLMYAVRNNRLEIVELILKNSDCVNQTNKGGQTALFEACRLGNHACTKLLIRAGSDMGITDRHGQTPLLLSLKHGNFDCVKVLLQHGANPSQIGSSVITGRWKRVTPMYVALLSRHPDMASILWDAMACTEAELKKLCDDPDVQDSLSEPSSNLKKWVMQWSSSPKPLVDMCLQVVSVRVGFTPERERRLNMLGLPIPFQNRLFLR